MLNCSYCLPDRTDFPLNLFAVVRNTWDILVVIPVNNPFFRVIENYDELHSIDIASIPFALCSSFVFSYGCLFFLCNFLFPSSNLHLQRSSLHLLAHPQFGAQI